MAMQNLFNKAKSEGLKIAEYFTPTLKDSKFHETGVITPEEFVAAGDHLVHHCPSWQWAAGDESLRREYLPADKQFLVTKNVPCYKRCGQMMDECARAVEKVIEAEGEDGEGGWVDTHHFAGDEDSVVAKAREMKLDDDEDEAKKGEAAAAATAVTGGEADGDSDQEAVDMDDFIESGMLEAEEGDAAAVAVVEKKKEKESSASGAGEILATRTYDLNITYDKYYQTPRLFLFGYDEEKRHLSVDQMYEDFSADHANKTITMEAHPHLPGPPQASVHPCRHAQVMKKLVDQIMEGGGELGVHMYLIVFLKFVQAIIPTIEYDFTQNFALD